MKASSSSPFISQLPCPPNTSGKWLSSLTPPPAFNLISATNLTRRGQIHARAVEQISAVTSDPVLFQGEVTWQIVAGAIVGVTPFVVAGVEFSKRIVAQKNCGVCGGSGLVLRDKKYYFRCPQCGGFLPWQSWKRFFSG